MGEKKANPAGSEPAGLNCDFHDRRLEAEKRAAIPSMP